MKRFFVGFVVILGVLLLSSPNPSEAHAYRADRRASSLEYLKIPQYFIFSTASDNLTLIHRPASPDKAFFKLDIAEIEEEVDYEQLLSSFKKTSPDNSHFSAIFCAQVFRNFFSYSKEVLSFHKYFSYTASSRYLILLAFRI